MTDENQNQQEPKVLKQFNPIKCPHCQELFYIGSQTMMYNIVSTPTIQEINEAKKKIKERLEEIEFADVKEKKDVFEYIDREDTILDSSDIEHFIKEITMDQLEKKKNNKEQYE
jgi:thiol-disulfide isomerase/thioredoxin